MQIKKLLAKAAACTTEKDASDLLDTLIEAFSQAKPLSHLGVFNQEAYLEDGQPYVRFELNREISNIDKYYVTMIRPEIRGGKLAVVVVTYHMKDGLGMGSKNWEVAAGLEEEVIEPDESATVAQVARQAKTLAIADHCKLIEHVGVPKAVAAKTATLSW
jgi:hypothetical protein